MNHVAMYIAIRIEPNRDIQNRYIVYGSVIMFIVFSDIL